MAGETSGTYFTANAVVDKTAAGTFIPEVSPAMINLLDN